MKLFKRPQTEPIQENYLELQTEVQSETNQEPIRHKGLYMKWKVVDGKLTRRWFHHPD